MTPADVIELIRSVLLNMEDVRSTGMACGADESAEWLRECLGRHPLRPPGQYKRVNKACDAVLRSLPKRGGG